VAAWDKCVSGTYPQVDTGDAKVVTSANVPWVELEGLVVERYGFLGAPAVGKSRADAVEQ
jgi:hypothetical protein